MLQYMWHRSLLGGVIINMSLATRMSIFVANFGLNKKTEKKMMADDAIIFGDQKEYVAMDQ